jgi:hypothetical protein
MVLQTEVYEETVCLSSYHVLTCGTGNIIGPCERVGLPGSIIKADIFLYDPFFDSCLKR